MRERRNFSNENAIIRSDNKDSRTITGYALVFDQESRDLGGFTEIIERTALDGVIPGEQDVLALYNHDSSRGVLARYTNGEGTLELRVDDIGLRYKFEADEKSPLANEVLSAITRGDISTSSFAFTIEEEAWEKRDLDYLRRIKRFKNIYDVSPVLRAAYPDTSVAARSLEEIKDVELKEFIKEVDEFIETLEKEENK